MIGFRYVPVFDFLQSDNLIFMIYTYIQSLHVHIVFIKQEKCNHKIPLRGMSMTRGSISFIHTSLSIMSLPLLEPWSFILCKNRVILVTSASLGEGRYDIVVTSALWHVCDFVLTSLRHTRLYNGVVNMNDVNTGDRDNTSFIYMWYIQCNKSPMHNLGDIFNLSFCCIYKTIKTFGFIIFLFIREILYLSYCKKRGYINGLIDKGNLGQELLGW